MEPAQPQPSDGVIKRALVDHMTDKGPMKKEDVVDERVCWREEAEGA